MARLHLLAALHGIPFKSHETDSLFNCLSGWSRARSGHAHGESKRQLRGAKRSSRRGELIVREGREEVE